MCEALKDVPLDEWESLKTDVRGLKENQQVLLQERATLRGWLKGWLVGVSALFVVVQILGGVIIKRALDLPEKNANEITALREIMKENMLSDQAHRDNFDVHTSSRQTRIEFMPRSELNLTLSAMEQRHAQTRAEMDRQFLDVKEQIIKLDAANKSQSEKLETKLDKLLDAK